MAGYDVTAAIVNQRAGQLAQAGRDWADEVLVFKAFLDRYADGAALSAAVPGLSQADATAIKNSFADLSNAVLTLRGQRAQSPASDFFFNAKLLIGVQ